MSEANACGPYDDRLEQRLAALKADCPGVSDRHFRLSLVRELRENTPLTLSAAREQVDTFLLRGGVEIPPDPPSAVLLAIGMLGIMIAAFVAPVFTLAVGGLLVASGHGELAARYWPNLLLASGACVWCIITMWCGPPLWRSYRRSSKERIPHR